MNLIDRVGHYHDGAKILADWIGDGGAVVDQKTAQWRADTCLKCPMHKQGSVFTESVALAIKRMLELKSKLNLRVRGEKQLHTCGACDCVMRLKVWMPEGRVQQVTDVGEFNSTDPGCWIRKEAA